MRILFFRLSRKRSKDKKWFATGLKCSTHHKSRLYRKWLKSHSADDENRYKSYLKIYKQVLRRAETLYYKEHVDTRVNSVKQLRTNVNHLLALNIKQKTQIEKLVVNNKVISDPKDISNTLNNYLCSVGKSLTKSLKVDKLEDFLLARTVCTVKQFTVMKFPELLQIYRIKSHLVWMGLLQS